MPRNTQPKEIYAAGAFIVLFLITSQVYSLGKDCLLSDAPDTWRIIIRSLGIIGFCIIEYYLVRKLRKK